MDISSFRQDYTKNSFSPEQAAGNPFDQFNNWFEHATQSKIIEPNAMIVSTVNAQHQPSSRVVLLKGIDTGYCFYTNYNSRKGQEIESNQAASILFFWPDLEQQIRIEGTLEKLTEQESEAYFHSRPRGSQLGAVVSPQSTVIPNREVLEDRWAKLENTYEGNTIPKPTHWGGYRLVPKYFEFWQGRSSRLHDRVAYQLTDNNAWEKVRLAP
jgi:pyridoxamine 5'-phosphate oxidase